MGFSLPYTPYNEVKQLEPGCFLDIDLSNFSLKKIFTGILHQDQIIIFFFNKKLNKKNFQSKFEQIISNYSISDKKMALSLSGGTDSFLTSYFLTKKIGKTSSFSLGFEDKTYDESKNIKDLDLNLEKIYIK